LPAAAQVVATHSQHRKRDRGDSSRSSAEALAQLSDASGEREEEVADRILRLVVVQVARFVEARGRKNGTKTSGCGRTRPFV
jgi:hypothetical protein